MSNVTQKLYFDRMKESRGTYFVEYYPPVPGHGFAILQLVFTQTVEAEFVVSAMEKEVASWVERYPVTVMASAFDDTGRLIPLAPVRSCNHLMAYAEETGSTVTRVWRLKDGEPPDRPLDEDRLRHIYSDIPYKTGEQLQQQAERHARVLRGGWWVVFIWLVLCPVTLAVIGFTSVWVGVAVLLYSLSKAAVQALRLCGKWPKSKRERQRQEEELRMHHHHYHCERNPNAFLQLKSKNFENDERERIRQEAEELETKMTTSPMHAHADARSLRH